MKLIALVKALFRNVIRTPFIEKVVGHVLLTIAATLGHGLVSGPLSVVRCDSTFLSLPSYPGCDLNAPSESPAVVDPAEPGGADAVEGLFLQRLAVGGLAGCFEAGEINLQRGRGDGRWYGLSLQ